jgi:DNA-binding SARP family transcriptional activator
VVCLVLLWARHDRVALLAYLALETTAGPVRRDALLALFWPELGEEEARRALRQGLHHLRRVVGDDVIVATGDELSLQEGTFRCDAAAFDQLVGQAGFWDDARVSSIRIMKPGGGGS